MKFALTLIGALLYLSSSAQMVSPDEVFYKYDQKSVNTSELLKEITKRNNEGKIFIKFDRWNLILEESQLLASEYRFINEKGEEIGNPSARPIPTNGYTSVGGRASLTFADGFLFGFIEEGKDLYYIEPARFYDASRNLDDIIIYNTKDVKPQAPVKCGFVESHAKKLNIGSDEYSSSSRAGLCYDVEYAIANDWSMFSKYGATSLEARNIGITNDVNTNYKDDFADEVRFVITGQYNSTCSSCDPWTASTNFNTLLDNFRTLSNGSGSAAINNPSSSSYIPFDVASLWSDRWPNSGTVGLAYVGVICTSSKYNILNDFSSNANSLRVLVAHEIGHNFNSNHDASGAGTIMAPSVNNTNTWSATSISVINNHIASRSCLSLCADLPSTAFFSSSALNIGEAGNGSAGTCGQPYQDYDIEVSLTKAPTSNLVVGFSASGTASAGYDFQLLTSSLTFTSGGTLSQNISVRVFDDVIEEIEETIDITLSIISGPGEASSSNVFTITLLNNDQIETDSGGSGDTIFYGNAPYLLNQNFTLFAGSSSDQKSRILLKANYLSSIGMVAGEIDLLAIYVSEKNSTGAFNNFRIGMQNVTVNDLDNINWQNNTEEVFVGNVTTVSEWNYFNFNTPFVWDGTSNIYVDFCFNNSSSVGLDRVALFSPESTGVQLFSWALNNSSNGCGPVNSWSLIDNYLPACLLRQKSSTEAETIASSTDSGRIKNGETAHLFSSNGRIIASIENTTSPNLDCIDATINTAGMGSSTLPFGSGKHTDKSFYIETSTTGTYNLTLYFTEEELSIWGGNNYSLNFVQSSVPIASASSANSSIITTSSVNVEIGASNVVAYTATVSGSGYFALTDGSSVSVVANVLSTFESADLAIEAFGAGILMKNNLGDQYLLKVDANGVLTTTLNNVLVPQTFIPEGDLCLITPSKGFYSKRTESSYTKVCVDDNGAIVSSNNQVLPPIHVLQENGHFGLEEAGAGLIFQNNQNECWKLFVDDSGNLLTVEVSCN